MSGPDERPIAGGERRGYASRATSCLGRDRLEPNPIPVGACGVGLLHLHIESFWTSFPHLLSDIGALSWSKFGFFDADLR